MRTHDYKASVRIAEVGGDRCADTIGILAYSTACARDSGSPRQDRRKTYNIKLGFFSVLLFWWSQCGTLARSRSPASGSKVCSSGVYSQLSIWPEFQMRERHLVML